MIFESKCCIICGNIRNTKLDDLIGNICIHCNDEKIKNWKSDVFCCISMEHRFRDGYMESCESWPHRELGLIMELVSFYDAKAAEKVALNKKTGVGKGFEVLYCPWCGFKITGEYIRKILQKYNRRINK